MDRFHSTNSYTHRQFDFFRVFSELRDSDASEESCKKKSKKQKMSWTNRGLVAVFIQGNGEKEKNRDRE